jgi:YbgC/YbaW family acyl-CoA thioester hydrolase
MSSPPAELPDPARIAMRRRVEWMDTDAAGIWHYTVAFRFAESAEAALVSALGLADELFGTTPRLSVTAQFRRSLRFNDLVTVELAVAAIGRTSLTYDLRIVAQEGVAMEGTMTICYVDRAHGGRAQPWRERTRELLAGAGLQVGEPR